MICTFLQKLSVVAFLTLGACSQFPELDGQISEEARSAPFPDLVPTSELRQEARTPVTSQAKQKKLDARAASLRNRAARLRGSVLSQSSKARLEQDIEPPPES